MPQRLRVKEIQTVGFVDKGDDPSAEIVFFKRQARKKVSWLRTTKERKMAKDKDKNGLLAGILKAFGLGEEEAQKILSDDADEMEFDVEKLEGEAKAAFEAAVAAAVKAKLDDEDDDEPVIPADVPESVAKVMDDFRKALDEQKARADKAEASLAKMAEDREREDYIRKVKALDLPGASPDDFAEILRKAEGALSDEERAKLDEVLKSAAAAAQAGLGELGFGGRGATSAEEEAEALAKKAIEADPKLSIEEARARVWQSHPELYKRYRDEHISNSREA